MDNLTKRLNVEPSSFGKGGFGVIRKAVLSKDSADGPVSILFIWRPLVLTFHKKLRLRVAVKFPTVRGDGVANQPTEVTISKQAQVILGRFLYTSAMILTSLPAPEP